MPTPASSSSRNLLHRLLASPPSANPWFSLHRITHAHTERANGCSCEMSFTFTDADYINSYIILPLNHMWDQHIPAACKCYEHYPNNPGHGADLKQHVPLLLLSQTVIGDTDGLIKGSAGEEGWERLARIQSLGDWLVSFCWSSFQLLCLNGRSFQS